eukprot:783259-Pleurochrysis_carterae.AAC.4
MVIGKAVSPLSVDDGAARLAGRQQLVSCGAVENLKRGLNACQQLEILCQPTCSNNQFLVVMSFVILQNWLGSACDSTNTCRCLPEEDRLQKHSHSVGDEWQREVRFTPSTVSVSCCGKGVVYG